MPGKLPGKPPGKLPGKSDGTELLTVAEAATLMGCTQGWVRRLIRWGEIKAKQTGLPHRGKRTWRIPLAAASAARSGLTSRSNGKRHLAVRPSVPREAGKKAAKPVRRK